MKIKGKIAVVTGASSGIGRATALQLAKKGAWVALIARDESRLTEVADLIRPTGSAIVFPCDLARPEEISRVFENIGRVMGRVDILVNAAGVGIWKSFFDITGNEHDRMMKVNYWGTYHTIRNVLPGMLERRQGKIINISSGSGKFGLSVTSGYSASKFAVTGLSEALHRELFGSGVGICCLHPGSVKTGFWDEENIDFDALPALIRYSPKISADSAARWIVRCIRLPIAALTFPIFVALLAKLNAIWIRIADLMLWKWFLPALGLLLLIRIITRYLL